MFLNAFVFHDLNFHKKNTSQFSYRTFSFKFMQLLLHLEFYIPARENYLKSHPPNIESPLLYYYST